MRLDLPIFVAAEVLDAAGVGVERGEDQPVDEEQVEEIIELMIPSLMSDSTLRRGIVCLSSGESVEAPYFDVDGHRVWGATAMILSELKEILRGMI